MEKTGLEPGRKLGQTIREMKRRQFEGRIRSKAEARRWLRSI
jgi:hypothetical protein